MGPRFSTGSKLLAAAVLAAFAVSPIFTQKLQPNAYEGGRSRDIGDRMVRNSSAIARLLGDLRTNMSDMVFIKTERYLHSGIAYDPHMEGELLSLTGETAKYEEHQQEVGVDDHEGHDHHHHDEEATATTILPPGRDYRGWIGKMHREIHPWQDPSEPHRHTDGTELLPWYRVMTLADPHNVRAYSVGAFWLRSLNLEEAESFALEGLRNNPDAFQLEYVVGTLATQRGLRHSGGLFITDDEETLVHYRRAMGHYQRAAAIGLKQRPKDYVPGGTDQSKWTHYNEDDLLATIRLGVLYERDYGSRSKAKQLAREYLLQLGSDPVLERFLATTE